MAIAMSPTDEDLMARFLAGDLDSFGLLATRYQAPLRSLAARYLGRAADAEEVGQEALLRAFTQARTFRPGSPFRPWLYRIALNLCRDRHRRLRRIRWVSLGADGAEGAPAAAAISSREGTSIEAVERREDARRVRRALAALPEEQRAVLVLKEMEGMKFREIAAVLGCPESTVKSRLYRGLVALRGQLLGQVARS